MGSASSKSTLQKRPSKEYRQKLEPLIRANHKHSLLLTNNEPNLISPTLVAAASLCVPPATLFDLWDSLSVRCTDAVSERSEEIIESEELIQAEFMHYLGDTAYAPAYVNFFDDECVRLLYNYEALLKLYLGYEEVCCGLLSNDGAGLKILACAVQLESCDCASDGLAASTIFYSSSIQLSSSASPTSSSRSTLIPSEAETERLDEQAVLERRRSLVMRVLRTGTCDRRLLNEVVVLHCIAVLHAFLPVHLFNQLWHYQSSKLNSAASSAPAEQRTEDVADIEDNEWQVITERAVKQRPEDLILLSVLKEYSPDGYLAAKKIITS